MRTPFFFSTAALVLLVGCGDAVQRGFAEDEQAETPKSYAAVVDAAALPNPEDAAPEALLPPAPRPHEVGGSVFGLASTLVLQNNGGDDLTFVADAHFTFPIRVREGETFDVTVKTPPANQTCTVRNGHGTVGQADITDVTVECGAVSHAVGGVVSNVHGALVLQLGEDTVMLTADGSFSFPKPVVIGSTYDVTVASQPQDQQCVVSRATKSGVVADHDVTSLVVGCTDFANASFESGFTGWTLHRDVPGNATAPGDTYGGAATITAGTTLVQGGVIHDVISDADVSLDYVSDALPATLLQGPGNAALLCAANGPLHLTATHDLTLSPAVTGLSFDLQYASGADLEDDSQSIRVQLLDPATNAVLATLTTIGTGSDPKPSATTLTGDVSACAGRNVRLQVEGYASRGPLYVAFDAFTLQ